MERPHYALFPNTKPRKNIPQQIIGADLAGDLAEVVEGFADVHGDEVGSDARIHAGQDVI